VVELVSFLTCIRLQQGRGGNLWPRSGL